MSGRRLIVKSVAALLLVAISGCGSSDASTSTPVAETGRLVAESSGCFACHGSEGQGTVGPAWRGLLGSTVELADGTTVTADHAYIRRSIVDPAADVVSGFTIDMPEIELTTTEIDALVAYISSL